jgi:hypothetical protein
MNRTSNARKQNSAAISHPSLLTAYQMTLTVTSGMSSTCAVSWLVTHYINAHDHRNLRKEAPMLRVGATGTNNNNNLRRKSCSSIHPSFLSAIVLCIIILCGGHIVNLPRVFSICSYRYIRGLDRTLFFFFLKKWHHRRSWVMVQNHFKVCNIFDSVLKEKHYLEQTRGH